MLCGDATNGEAVARLLGGRQALLVVTDFPDVIVRRWQVLTGKEATLDGDGRSFEEVGRERRMALRANQGRKDGRRAKSRGAQAEACATTLPKPTAEM